MTQHDWQQTGSRLARGSGLRTARRRHPRRNGSQRDSTPAPDEPETRPDRYSTTTAFVSDGTRRIAAWHSAVTPVNALTRRRGYVARLRPPCARGSPGVVFVPLKIFPSRRPPRVVDVPPPVARPAARVHEFAVVIPRESLPVCWRPAQPSPPRAPSGRRRVWGISGTVRRLSSHALGLGSAAGRRSGSVAGGCLVASGPRLLGPACLWGGVGRRHPFPPSATAPFPVLFNSHPPSGLFFPRTRPQCWCCRLFFSLSFSISVLPSFSFFFVSPPPPPPPSSPPPLFFSPAVLVPVALSRPLAPVCPHGDSCAPRSPVASPFWCLRRTARSATAPGPLLPKKQHTNDLAPLALRAS